MGANKLHDHPVNQQIYYNPICTACFGAVLRLSKRCVLNRISRYIKSNNPFVQIVVNILSVVGIFDYAVPESLAEKIGVRHLVIVPFGKQTVQAVICISILLSLRSLRA